MSVKANNFKLGIFVIASVLLLLIALSMLGAGALFKKSVMFETVFTESVQGLEVGAPIKSQGVKIGTVSKIDFAKFTYPLDSLEQQLDFGNYILVEMDMDPRMMTVDTRAEQEELLLHGVERGFRVRMASSGLTGPPYLAVSWVDPESNPPPDIYYTPRMLYVPSSPSTINRIVSAVENILAKLEDLPTGEIANKVQAALTSFDTAVQEVRPGIAELNRLVRRVDNMVAEQEGDIQAIVVELRSVLDNIEDISENAKGYPSQMLFGDPPPRINPTELNGKPKK